MSNNSSGGDTTIIIGEEEEEEQPVEDNNNIITKIPLYTEMQQQLITFNTWYNNDRNKWIIFHFSLFTWVLMNTIFIMILTLTSYSFNRAGYYIPLVIYPVLLYFSTYWVLNSFIVYYIIWCKTRNLTNDTHNNDNTSSILENL